MADIEVIDEGSVAWFRPLTEAGLRFIKQYLLGVSFTGEYGTLVVEWRYAADLADRMRAAGLKIEVKDRKGDLTKEDLRQILLASLQAVAEERERVQRSLDEKSKTAEEDQRPESGGNDA